MRQVSPRTQAVRRHRLNRHRRARIKGALALANGLARIAGCTVVKPADAKVAAKPVATAVPKLMPKKVSTAKAAVM